MMGIMTYGDYDPLLDYDFYGVMAALVCRGLTGGVEKKRLLLEQSLLWGYDRFGPLVKDGCGCDCATKVYWW